MRPATRYSGVRGASGGRGFMPENDINSPEFRPLCFATLHRISHMAVVCRINISFSVFLSQGSSTTSRKSMAT